MRVSLFQSIALAAFVTCIYGVSCAQLVRPIQEITIVSNQGNVRRASRTEISIRKVDGRYVTGSESVDAGIVDTGAVEALSRALNEPVNSTLVPTDLGITPQWLKSNASIYTNGNVYTEHTPEEEALFEKMFADPARIETVLPSVYQSRHTDDYPSVEIRVTYADGGILFLSSSSQHAFMLPWVTKSASSIKEYNADISRAVAQLMPEKSANRSRLAGTGLAFELATVVLLQANSSLRAGTAEAQAGAALTVLRSRYNVLSEEIRKDDHPDQTFLAHMPAGEAETALHVTLGSIHLPAKLTEAVVLPYQDGEVPGIEEFLHKAPALEALVVSVPWLHEFLEDNSLTPVRLLYVRDGSLTDAAMKEFAEEMTAIGKADLVPEVEKVQTRVALLMTGANGGIWLVLPDKRTILWRYNGILSPGFGSTHIFNWAQSDFNLKPCRKQTIPFGGCSGTVISPYGQF